MPNLVISAKKFRRLLRPSAKGQTSTQPSDDLDSSEKAKELWEKNNELIKSLGQPLDGNRNETSPDDEKTADAVDHVMAAVIQTSGTVGEVMTDCGGNSGNVSELACEILKELMNGMRDIFTLAKNDPVLLRTCFEIIEVQRRKDEFAKDAEHIENQIERPLQWDQKCLAELHKHLGNRLKSASCFEEEKSANFLQEIIQNLEDDLNTIKNFVNECQQNDDYVFRTVAEAYRSHLYHLMEEILKSEMNDTQVNSILIFHGDFRRKFPKELFADFWQEMGDGSKKLHIIPENKYRELVERYMQNLSKTIKEHLDKGRRVEIEINPSRVSNPKNVKNTGVTVFWAFWLSEKEPNQKSRKVDVTQWPVDVLDLCNSHMKVSQQIGPEAYYQVLSLLKKELENAIRLYGAGVKYYIHPEKSVLPKKHPEFEILKRQRGRASQDPPPCFRECLVYAIMNNFSVLHEHLSTLSKEYKDENGIEQFVTLQSVVKEQADECLEHYKQHIFHPSMVKYSKHLLANDWWDPYSEVTDKLCKKISTYVSSLDATYFEDWFEQVREEVHLVYLQAICKRCQEKRCKTEEDRCTVVSRLQAERRKIEMTVKEVLPCYKNDFIVLLDQVAAVVGCNTEESCITEVSVLKAKQQRIITRKHLKSILILNGAFKEKHQKRIIGNLFSTNEVQSLEEPKSNPICSGQSAASSSDEETSE